jgi:hypothetical protein
LLAQGAFADAGIRFGGNAELVQAASDEMLIRVHHQRLARGKVPHGNPPIAPRFGQQVGQIRGIAQRATTAGFRWSVLPGEPRSIVWQTTAQRRWATSIACNHLRRWDANEQQARENDADQNVAFHQYSRSLAADVLEHGLNDLGSAVVRKVRRHVHFDADFPQTLHPVYQLARYRVGRVGWHVRQPRLST